MSFSDMWSLAKRRWVIIAMCALGGVLSGLVQLVTAASPPSYSSVSQVFVNGSADSVADAVEAGRLASSRINSYAALLRGPELTSMVIGRLHLDLTPSELAVRILPAPTGDAVVLSFSVSDPDAARAQEISGAVATALSELIMKLETPAGRSSPLIVAQPVGEAGPADLNAANDAPSTIRVLGLGGFVGAIIGFSLAALVDLRARRRRAET